MSNNYLKKLISHKKELLKLWEDHYYKGRPLVTDEHYDASIIELKHLESLINSNDPNSPTNKIGQLKNLKYIKKNHIIPMLSLNNVFTEKDLTLFHTNNTKDLTTSFSYFSEPKIDGMSISLTYTKGILNSALTRGNGEIGEDILNNVCLIPSIPKKIFPIPKHDVHVRGEIYITKSNFKKLNRQQFLNRKNLFSNPRNLVTGTMRALTPNQDVIEHTSVAIYQIVNAESFNLKTQYDCIKKIREWNLPTHDPSHCSISDSYEVLKSNIDKFGHIKDELDFPCDGLVIKVNSFKEQTELGTTNKFPRWAVAYKYSTNIATSKILSISHLTGRTGKINYIAHISPTLINGTTIKNVTLHNAEYIQNMKIHINDTITIYKAGEIIPKILSVVLEERSFDSTKWIPPITCNSCNSLLIKKEKKIDQYCINEKCSSKIIQQIIYAASKSCLDIIGISEGIIKKLFNLKILSSFADLYSLKNHKKIILENNINIKEKLFNKLLDSIESSKQKSLKQFIIAFGIDGLGERNATFLCSKISDLHDFKNIKISELNKIEQLTKIIKDNILEWLSNENNILLIDTLLKWGVNPKNTSEYKKYNSFLSNKNVVISGTFSISRQEIILQLKNKYNVNIQNQINKNTNYLLLGASPGSKHQKAIEKGINIIQEKDISFIHNDH